MMSAIAMTLMLVASLSCFAYLMIPRTKVLLNLQPDARFDQVGERIKSVVKFAIGQWRMPREPIAGFAHIMIFSGFMVVALGTILHIAHAYAGNLVDSFYLETGFGKLYAFIKDIFEFLVIIGVSYGIWRRLKPTPSRVGRSAEGVFVLFMIMTLMLTDFLAFAGVLIQYEVVDTTWYPGAALAKGLIQPLGNDTALMIANGAYWVHCFAVLLFLNFLPLGKHFHVITGIPNVFFRSLTPYGQVAKMEIDLEDEDPSFGMRSTADLSWKMVLDTYSCTECGRCTVYCPTVLTDKPLAHRALNLSIKDAVYEDLETLTSGDAEKKAELPDLVSEGRIDSETIWACTTCGSCEQECPVFIENVPRIIQMRQHKVMMEGDISPELQRAFQGMENNSNPWGIGFDKRDEWAEGLEVPRMADWVSNSDASKENPPLLFWVGCAGSFDDRTKKVTQAMVQILKAADVPFAILGKEEGCTGDPARRSGNEYLFQELAATNVEVLNNYGVKKVLTTCPHCLHTIKREYPQFEGNFEVVHHTELIDQLIAEGKLNLKDDGEKHSLALHDSCYLGRYHDIYEAPRNVVNAVPGMELIELPRNKSRSVCCGAGGGRFWMEEHIGERINVHRSQEIAETNSTVVGSNCPFCLTMISDGMKAVGKEEVETLDLAEIVARKLEGGSAEAAS